MYIYRVLSFIGIIVYIVIDILGIDFTSISNVHSKVTGATEKISNLAVMGFLALVSRTRARGLFNKSHTQNLYS